MAEGGIRSDAAAATDHLSRRLSRPLHQAIRLDPDSSRPVYIGFAQPGTDDASPAWSICQLEYSSPVSDNIVAVRWAEGTIAYVWAWTTRAALTYT